MQNEGIAAVAMLTKNMSADNESARHGPIRIGGCDSMSFTMCILSGSLKQSWTQIGKRGRSAARGCSGIWLGWTEEEQWAEGRLRPSLSSADTSEPDLPQSLSPFPVVPVLLPCLQKLLPDRSCLSFS